MLLSRLLRQVVKCVVLVLLIIWWLQENDSGSISWGWKVLLFYIGLVLEWLMLRIVIFGQLMMGVKVVLLMLFSDEMLKLVFFMFVGDSLWLWVLVVSLLIFVVIWLSFFLFVLCSIGIIRLLGVFMVMLMCIQFFRISVLLDGFSELFIFGNLCNVCVQVCIRNVSMVSLMFFFFNVLFWFLWNVFSLVIFVLLNWVMWGMVIQL